MTPSPGTRAEAARAAGQLQRVFRTALWVVPFGVLANIGFSLAVTDRATLASLGAFPRGYLFLAVALGLVPWVTNALRLGIWTRFIGHPLRFRDTLRITLGTELGSSVTPTASGGGLFRWGMLMGHGVSPGAAASVISLGVMEDALFFLLAVPTALLLVPVVDLPVLEGIGSRLGGQAARIALWGALFALAVLAAAIAALRGRFGRRVQRRGLRLAGRGRRRARATGRDARQVYALVIRRGKARFALSLGLTTVQWGCRYSVISALAAFLGAPVSPLLFWVLQWVVFSLMSFVPTPGASVGAEAVFYLVYAPFLPERVIGLAMTGWRFLTFYLQLTLGALLFTALNALSRHAGRARGGDGTRCTTHV